jgi:hypothetical protein
MWFFICLIGHEFSARRNRAHRWPSRKLEGPPLSGWFVDARAGFILNHLFQLQPLRSNLSDRVRVIPCSRLDNARWIVDTPTLTFLLFERQCWKFRCGTGSSQGRRPSRENSGGHLEEFVDEPNSDAGCHARSATALGPSGLCASPHSPESYVAPRGIRGTLAWHSLAV